MNLQILLLLMASAGVLIGWLTGRYAGYALTLSTIVGFLIGIAPLFLLPVSGRVLSAWSPDRSDCLCGRCRSEDYIYGSMERGENGRPCAYRYHYPECGTRYVSRDDHFLEVREGCEVLYRKLNRWGRWSSSYENDDEPGIDPNRKAV